MWNRGLCPQRPNVKLRSHRKPKGSELSGSERNGRNAFTGAAVWNSRERELLAEIHITEMQEDRPGYPHPNAASVSIRSTRRDPLPRSPFGLPPADFNGYSVSSRSTGSVDQKGNWTSFSCCHARHINIDERATPAQLSQSLNFQLHCLTSFLRCKDDRQILP